MSSLGQPLKAEIDLVSRPDELANLSSRIASPAAYGEADLLYNPLLAGVSLNVKQLPNGQAYLEVVSSRPVNEPFLHLLVELVGGKTRFIRGYTVLIDPFEFRPPPVAPARAAALEVPPAAEAKAVVGSRTTARVDEKAAAPKRKDVVRKGEPSRVVAADPGETPGLNSRIKTLEDQSALRAKGLAGLNERITSMEKAVRAMQRLLESRKPEIAAAPKPAAVKPPAREPDTRKAEVAVAPKPAAVKPPPQKPDTRKPEVAVAPKPAAVEPPAQKPEPARPEAVAAVAPEKAATETKKAEPDTASPAKQPVAQTEPEIPKAKSAPPPSESGLLESFIGVPLLLAAGAIVILLCGVAYWMSRRRPAPEVTPEDMLNKLLTRNPDRDDIQLKLIEFYAARKDMPAFHTAAGKFHTLTGGQGESWLKVAAMGYALDPGNPLYEAGRPAPLTEPTTVIAG